MSKAELEIPEPYHTELKGILKFSDFDQTEKTIESLEKLCRKYRKASDKKGEDYCRKIGLLGRRRAERISRNRRVDARKRLEKREIAEWFRIWLETPDLFGDWLALRKRSEEFKRICRQ